MALVEPDGRGVRLTREGRILALAATDAAALLQRAVERVRDQEAIAALSVGFLRSLGPSVVGELVASFLVDRPDVVVTHHEGAGGDLLEAVESGVVDVAVLTPRPSRRLHWLRLGQQAMTLTVPVGHRLAQGGAVRLAQVRDEPFLALDHRFDTRRVAEELCAAEGFTPRVTLEADSVTTLRDYVAAGLGVAVLPADTSADARTVTLPLATPRPRGNSVWCGTPAASARRRPNSSDMPDGWVTGTPPGRTSAADPDITAARGVAWITRIKTYLAIGF